MGMIEWLGRIQKHQGWGRPKNPIFGGGAWYSLKTCQRIIVAGSLRQIHSLRAWSEMNSSVDTVARADSVNSVRAETQRRLLGKTVNQQIGITYVAFASSFLYSFNEGKLLTLELRGISLNFYKRSSWPAKLFATKLPLRVLQRFSARPGKRTFKVKLSKFLMSWLTQFSPRDCAITLFSKNELILVSVLAWSAWW